MTSTYNIFTLRSSQRNTSIFPSTTTPVTLNLPHNVNCNKIELIAANIPNTSYAITSSNNTLTVEVTGPSAATITITPGTYTSLSFISELQTKLNASGLGLTFTVSISAITFLMTISATGSFIIYNNSISTIASLLGYPSTTGSATSHTATNVIKLNNTENYFVRFNEVPALNQDFIIPNDVNYGAIKYFKKGGDYPLYQNLSNVTPVSKLTFNILDDNGNYVDFHGADWSFTLIFYNIDCK